MQSSQHWRTAGVVRSLVSKRARLDPVSVLRKAQVA